MGKEANSCLLAALEIKTRSAFQLQLTGAKYMVMEGDIDVVESGGKKDFQYGNEPAALYAPTKVDRVLRDGDQVKLGDGAPQIGDLPILATQPHYNFSRGSDFLAFVLWLWLWRSIWPGMVLQSALRSNNGLA